MCERETHTLHYAEFYREEAKLNPCLRRAINYLDLAEGEVDVGNITKAMKLYKASIRAFPTAEAHTYLGWMYSKRGNLRRAIHECLMAISVDPTFGNAFNDIATYMTSEIKIMEAAAASSSAQHRDDGAHRSAHHPQEPAHSSSERNQQLQNRYDQLRRQQQHHSRHSAPGHAQHAISQQQQQQQLQQMQPHPGRPASAVPLPTFADILQLQQHAAPTAAAASATTALPAPAPSPARPTTAAPAPGTPSLRDRAESARSFAAHAADSHGLIPAGPSGSMHHAHGHGHDAGASAAASQHTSTQASPALSHQRHRSHAHTSARSSGGAIVPTMLSASSQPFSRTHGVEAASAAMSQEIPRSESPCFTNPSLLDAVPQTEHAISNYLRESFSRPEDAIVWFERAQKAPRSTNRPAPYLNLGTLYWRLGYPEKALIQFREGLKCDPLGVSGIYAQQQAVIHHLGEERARRVLDQTLAFEDSGR